MHAGRAGNRKKFADVVFQTGDFLEAANTHHQFGATQGGIGYRDFRQGLKRKFLPQLIDGNHGLQHGKIATLLRQAAENRFIRGIKPCFAGYKAGLAAVAFGSARENAAKLATPEFRGFQAGFYGFGNFVLEYFFCIDAVFGSGIVDQTGETPADTFFKIDVLGCVISKDADVVVRSVQTCRTDGRRQNGQIVEQGFQTVFGADTRSGGLNATVQLTDD